MALKAADSAQAAISLKSLKFQALPVCTENWIRLDARQRLGNPATR